MESDMRCPVILTIAGSDSGAGAGIQADMKTFAAHAMFGVTVLTVITAQSTTAVNTVYQLSGSLIKEQIRTIREDFRIAAIKTGALGNSESIIAVADGLSNLDQAPLVIDPVMFSKHGASLIAAEAVACLNRVLLPRATVITPNLHEAQALSGISEISSRSQMLEAAEIISRHTPAAIVLKGGHLQDRCDDLLWQHGEFTWIEGERVDSAHLHGTGCTFSAAITANLGRGMAIEAAVRAAKLYITGAIRHGMTYGKGINPVNHFWQTMPRFGCPDEPGSGGV